MKLSEANAVNTLISLLVGHTPYSLTPSYEPSDDEVLEAVRALVSGAHKTIGAGWRPDQAAAALLARFDAVNRELVAEGDPHDPPAWA